MANKHYMPNEQKEYYGDKIIDFLLKLNPNLTKIQIKRICCNIYQRMYAVRNNIYDITKKRLRK